MEKYIIYLLILVIVLAIIYLYIIKNNNNSKKTFENFEGTSFILGNEEIQIETNQDNISQSTQPPQAIERQLNNVYQALNPAQISFMSTPKPSNFYYTPKASISYDKQNWYPIANGTSRVEWTSKKITGEILFNVPKGWFYKIEEFGKGNTQYHNIIKRSEDIEYYEFPLI